MNKLQSLSLATAALAMLSVPHAHAQLDPTVTSFDVSGQAPTGFVVLGQGDGAATGNAQDGFWNGFGVKDPTTGIGTSNLVVRNNYDAPGAVAINPGDGNLQDDFYYDGQGVAAITGTINGLTIGQPYTLVIYASLGNSQDIGASITLSGGATGTAETSGVNTNIGSNGAGGLGISYQEFTVTPTARTINFTITDNTEDTGSYAVLQGIQITEAVPEPSTYALLAAGVGGLCFFQRARRKA